MTEPITEVIPPESGKRNPYESVTVGRCDRLDPTNSSKELCAAFRLATPMAGDNNDVVLKESDLQKSLKNGMDERISGYTQAARMIKSYKGP